MNNCLRAARGRTGAASEDRLRRSKQRGARPSETGPGPRVTEPARVRGVLPDDPRGRPDPPGSLWRGSLLAGPPAPRTPATGLRRRPTVYPPARPRRPRPSSPACERPRYRHPRVPLSLWGPPRVSCAGTREARSSRSPSVTGLVPRPCPHGACGARPVTGLVTATLESRSASGARLVSAAREPVRRAPRGARLPRYRHPRVPLSLWGPPRVRCAGTREARSSRSPSVTGLVPRPCPHGACGARPVTGLVTANLESRSASGARLVSAAREPVRRAPH
ncbi:hypothetical protein NDU88_000397 [Pleurodeles waltl]|uniref:Uncharacterized protein n=1 Tax=Pleurodeles waltl TaxID=8319 RepID=A0AAV7WFE2_PLEWA|nr:hypothetical protein NDU88_000397 [Pleurodeles waltl]